MTHISNERIVRKKINTVSIFALTLILVFTVSLILLPFEISYGQGSPNNAPVLTVPTKVRIGIPSGDVSGLVIYNASAYDKQDGSITPTCNPESGSQFPAGNTTVTCTVTDRHGNTSIATFDVLVGRVTITHEPYSELWNRALPLKVNVTGYEQDDKLEIKRGTTSLANVTTTGNSNTDTPLTVTLPKFPSSDSGTTVNVTAVLVETLGDAINFGNDTTGIEILPHSTQIITSTFSDGFVENSVSEIGTITDTDDNVQVPGLPITFTGLSLPATSSSGITITDLDYLSASSGNLIIHKNTIITNSSATTSFYQADITFTGLAAGQNFNFTLTPLSNLLTPNTQQWFVPTNDDLTIPLYFGGGESLKEIKINDIPGSTAKISNIVIRNSAGDIVHDIYFTDPIATGVQTITENDGRFSSVGALSSEGTFAVIASFAGNSAYSSSSGTAADLHANAGVGGSATVVADSGMGVAAVVCGSDADNDYLCDNWEGSGATDGIPFVVTNYNTGTTTTYYYKLTGSDKNKKDIYVESDYMSGHTPNPDASLDVTNLFASKGIVLHHIIDESIPHSESTALWGDTNMVIGDDFNSLKMIYFGGVSEHPKLGGTVSVTCSDCATSQSTHTIKISGITLQTPSTALTGGATSGKVTVKATVTLLTGTTSVVHKITAPSVTGTNAAIKIGPLTTSDLTVTGSTATKTFTITVPFSTTAATGSLVNLGDIIIPFTTKSTADVASAAAPTTASVATAGSPRINTSLTDAIAQGVHYIPWIHSIGTCGPSGQAELPGNDGVVSLGCNFDVTESGFAYPAGDTRKATVGNRQQQSGTFLHELSHNLGINHGGPQKLLVTENGFAAGTSPADTTINCKPQYTSVMSYARQFPSFLSLSEWVLDLSNGGHSPLTESSLVESTGVTGSAATIVWGTPQSSPTTLTKKGLTGTGLDWNNAGGVSGTQSANINNLGISGCNLGGTTASTTISYDWNDWAHLDFNLRKSTGGQLDGLLGEETPEVVKQTLLVSSIFDGFYNPPPYDDASKNAAKPGSRAPVKLQLVSQSGDILAFAKLTGEYRIDTEGPTYKKFVCTNTNSDKFAWSSTDKFYSCIWKLPKPADGTKIYFKINLDTEVPNAPKRMLVDQSPPTGVSPFPYTDQDGNIVTNYLRIQS